MKYRRFYVSLIALILALSMLPALSISAFAATNEQIIFDYLTTKMGINSAAACGVLANIEKESGFNPNIYGDGGTSYGICQWHDMKEGVGRFTNLKNYCAEHSLDYQTLEGQLEFLSYELENLVPRVWNALFSAENSEDGAFGAAYAWCYYFEIPANREVKAVERGNLAKEKYWPIYGTDAPTFPEGKYEVWVVGGKRLQYPYRAGHDLPRGGQVFPGG